MKMERYNYVERMYCSICGRLDKSHTAYCIYHGRCPHKSRKVKQDLWKLFIKRLKRKN